MVGVVTLSLVTIDRASVSRQFRFMQERARATRLEALRLPVTGIRNRVPSRRP